MALGFTVGSRSLGQGLLQRFRDLEGLGEVRDFMCSLR